MLKDLFLYTGGFISLYLIKDINYKYHVMYIIYELNGHRHVH